MESLTLTRVPCVGSSGHNSSRIIHFFSNHPFLLHRWLSFLIETPYIARERESERAKATHRFREREMESEGSGVGGCSVGSIIWVRRRNGSWWPEKILGSEELDTSHLTSPCSGTPIKLLKREDVNISLSFSFSLSQVYILLMLFSDLCDYFCV